MSDTNEKLLPCPFCGNNNLNGPHITEYIGDSYDPHWWVECDACPSGMTVYSEDVRELIKAWNSRS